MRMFHLAILSSVMTCPDLMAGSINVVHLGPGAVTKFEIRAGDAAQDFTLSHGSDTGPFFLPEKPVTIKGFGDGIPSLEVPVSENPRIALLIPGEKGFEWRLHTAKPSPDKWAFRIVNLSAEPAEAKSAEAMIKIPGEGEMSLEVAEKSQLTLKISDSVDLSYEETEPRGVVAFIYRDNQQWRAIFVPDR